MKTYAVETPILHDGRLYAPGSSIRLEDDDAAALLARRAISGPIAAPVVPVVPKGKAK